MPRLNNKLLGKTIFITLALVLVLGSVYTLAVNDFLKYNVYLIFKQPIHADNILWKTLSVPGLPVQLDYPVSWTVINELQDKQYQQSTPQVLTRYTFRSPDFRLSYSGGDWGALSSTGGDINLAISETAYTNLNQIVDEKNQSRNEIYKKIKLDFQEAIIKEKEGQVQIYSLIKLLGSDKPRMLYLEISYNPNSTVDYRSIFDRFTASFMNTSSFK